MDYEDPVIDYYLDKLREDTNLTEIEPMTMGIVAGLVGTGLVVGNLISFFMGVRAFKNSIKVDKKLSERINEILKSDNTWKVHIFPDVAPNAFAISGNDVFITTKLVNILTEREIDAVLLHEIYHNKDLHVWKKLAFDSAFTYLVVFVSVTTSLTLFIPLLGFIVAFLLREVGTAAYARMIGRRHEYKADEFAVQYGYGPELVSSLTKIEGWANKIKSSKKCEKWCQLERKISDAIDEHPPFKKRVEIILRKTNELNRSINSGFGAINKFVLGVFKNNG